MKKKKTYDIQFCSCGRIHVMSFDEIEWLSEDYKNRSIIRACANCGKANVTFLTEGFEQGTFDVNCCDLERYGNIIWNNTKLFYSRGIKVYMKSGKEADTEQSGYFANCEEWTHMNGSGYQPIEAAEKERKDWATVDTERLIETIKREYMNDADDILRSISGYAVKIHWEGTKYETDWNK